MGLGIGHGLNDDAQECRKREQMALVHKARVFHAVGNSDHIEGRGQRVTVGWYFTRDEAFAGARGNGVYGGDVSIEERNEQVVQFLDAEGYPIPGEAYILGEQLWTAEKAQRSLRESARAKLTAEEWAALGLPR